MSTPSEKPVSKRRTPPAWPAYHGENPTCAHRQIEAHNFFAQMRIGNRIHYTTETMWCPGPGISTEPETPVTEDATRWPDPPRCAKCDHFMKEASCIVRRCPCDCDWIPASDPTPEIRERLETIAGYHDPHDSEGTQWCRACGTCFPCVTRVELDALLDEVGEKKSNG